MYKFANANAVVSWQGEGVALNRDDIWHADDPFVLDKPQFFADEPSFVHRTNGHTPGVEQMPPTGNRRRSGR